MSAEESESRTPRQKLRCGVLLSVLIVIGATWLISKYADPDKKRIGATASVTEVSTGLLFHARVDTGAAVSSIHCEEVRIEDESPDPTENVGRQVQLVLTNAQGERRTLETVIADYSPIRSVDAAKSRYYVRLLLSCQGIERELLVTLNDRSKMSHRLLIGRNFLRDDFLVDVSRDNPGLY